MNKMMKLLNEKPAIARGGKSIRMLKLLMFPMLFILCIGNADAAVKKWIGGTSSDWNNAANWEGGVFPGLSNDGLIDPANYTYAPVISVNSTHSFKKLIVQNGGVLTIQANMDVKDDITVKDAGSRIDHSAGTLSISVAAKDIFVLSGATYNLTGGTLTGTALLYISESTFNLSGSAALNVGSSLSLYSSAANSLFNMTGGTVNVTTSVIFDGNNKPLFNQTIAVSGGTFTNNGPTYYNRAETDNSIFNVSGGTVTLTGVVQDNTTGKIQFNVSSGSLTFQNNVSFETGDELNQTGGTITFEGGNRTFTNAGTVNCTGGTVVFNDATATLLTGAGTWNFNNVTINSGRTLNQSAAANINVAGNWTNNGTYTPSLRRVTLNGTGAQNINGNFYDLTTNKASGTVTLTANVNATNSLTMTAGNINTSTFKLTLGTSTSSTGTLNYTAGTIIGKYEKWLASTGASRIFPVGTATAHRPLTTIFTNLTAGSLIVEFIASNPGSSGLPLVTGGANITNQFTEGYWELTAANSLASTNYEIQLTTTGFTSYTINNNTRVIKRANSGSAWTLDGTHVYPSGGVSRRTGLSGVGTSQFGLATTTCTAPTATVAQNVTTDVAQGSINNEIIRIAVSAYGTTCTDNITQFNFNTTGSSAAGSDISNAKLYYTGSSSTFATTTLFGSLGSAPNGAFSINGSVATSNNTEYFWLVYDINTAATRTNVVDAQLVSFVVAGNTNTSITNGNPAGSRTIKADRYAVANGSYNSTSTWAFVSGGAPGASVPTSVNDVYIESGYTVTLTSAGMTARNITMTAGAARNLLQISTGGTLTCSSITMSTTNKRPELYVDGSGQLTVNGSVAIDYSNCTEGASNSFWITGTAQVNITGNLDLVNTSSKKLIVLQNGATVLTVGGNITFNNNTNDKAHLAMGGTARLNIAGNFVIPSGKYGKLYADDALLTTVINFNGTSPQTLELATSAANSNQWQYANVLINNTAGVTMNGNVVAGATYNAITKSLVVQTGTLNSGGFSMQLPNETTSLFEVQNGATYVTTSTGSYGGIAYFGTNQGNGKITFGATSTINFAATSAQVIPGLGGINGTPYGNVILSGSGTKTITNAHHANFSAATIVFDINGNLTIANGATLDVSVNNYGITAAGNWTDQNSSTGAGFTRRLGTVTFDGTGTQTIALTSPQTFYNFTTSKPSGGIAITGNAIVANILSMSCNFTMTGASKLTLGINTAAIGTLTYTSGSIIGKFERWMTSTGGTNRLFPLGTASAYRPANLIFTVVTGGTLTGEFIATDPGSTGLPLVSNGITMQNQFTEGYWEFTAANSFASTNYELLLTATGFTSYTLAENVRIIKRANSGSSWTLDGTHQALLSSVARRTGMSGIATAQFALARTICPTGSATAAQNVTTDVGQGTTNNEILRIAVSTSGSTCTDIVTQFNFNTTGTTNAATDLSNAKVYFTGTSSTFSTATLFGTLGSVPNGSFSITGTQNIYNDLVYFWLVYDIAPTATRNNVVDAQFVSFVAGGNTNTNVTNGNPAGSRTIKAERYAVATGFWNATSTWSYVAGGAPGAIVPIAADNVFIDPNYTVTINSTEACKNLVLTSNALKSKLIITTGGALTCDSIYMGTSSKKTELHLTGTGSLTVNRNVLIDWTNQTEDANNAFYLKDASTAIIKGNLDLLNPSAKRLVVCLENTSVTSVYGNLTFNGNVSDKTQLEMKNTARLNIKKAFIIPSGKFGKLIGDDNSIVNFNGTSAQILELTPNVLNSSMWRYSTVWISNPAGVTLNANVTLGTTYATIQQGIIVKSGVLKTGGYSIQLVNNVSFFQVDDNATFITTTTDAYGGMPYFGTNQNGGSITLGAASTVKFAANANQVIPTLNGVKGSAYGNIVLAGSGTKTVAKVHHNDFSGATGMLDINGSLTISNGTTLDVSASNFAVTIADDWTDQNTVGGTGFVSRTGTVTFDGSISQSITLSASPLSFYNLVINKSAANIYLYGDVRATNALTMTAGNIVAGTSKLTLGTSTANTGTLTRTTGTITGKFERWVNATGTNILFPVGTLSNYRPQTLNFTNLTAGSMIVEFIASVPGNSGLPVSAGSVNVNSAFPEGYWQNTAANSLASTNYNITVVADGFTSSAIGFNTRLIKRANSGSPWTLNGTHVNASGTTLTRTGLSSVTADYAVGATTCVGGPVPAITISTNACNNASNGALTLATTGGTAPYTYVWSNGATTQNISGLSENTYTVTVTDANFCSATASKQIGVGVTMAVTHMTDFNNPNGAIDVTVTGEAGPFTFLWNKKNETITTEDRTGILNGYHTVSVTDASGCVTVKSALVAYMDTIKAGSFIVNMGVMPQTIGNGLKPYGFIYDMIKNRQVPVSWCINPNKGMYGVDFSHNGIDYKGGPFIIESEFIDNIIDSRIEYWKTQGMVGDYTVSDIVVPIYATITGFSNLGIDQANEGLVIPYFTNASVPSDIYYVGLPNMLGSCDNAYVLPHADPTWATHNYLRTFVNAGGYFWSGCHAVSMYEGIVNPSDPTQKMNFLSKTGLQCYSGGKCGAISETHAGTPTSPFTHNTSLATHPLMQNMGDMTPSQDNGSEKWYIPVTTGGWNVGTMRAITTADGAVGREGVKLVFGRAFDDKDKGIVMYQAGHTSNAKGTIESQVAFQRSFFNFILNSSLEFKLRASVSVPSQMAEGSTENLALTIHSGGAPFTYEWSTNVSGSFGSPNSASTTFTLNRGNGRPYARVSVKVTDACGRIYFETRTISVLYLGKAIVSDYNGYNVSCQDGDDGSITLVPQGGTPPYTYNWSIDATTKTVTGLSAGTYYATITDAMSVSVFDTITLNEPPTHVSATIAGTDSLTCYTATNGSISLTVSGGITPYTYQWSSGNATQNLSIKRAGTYSVTVTDKNGCETYQSHTINAPDSIQYVITPTNVSCNGGSNGSIGISASVGVAPYDVYDADGLLFPLPITLTDLPAFSQEVWITDASGCSTNPFTIELTEPDAITSVLTAVNSSSDAIADGSISQVVSGGVAPYSYAWSNGATTKNISSLLTGPYTVTITDANGCTVSYFKYVNSNGSCNCTWLGTTSTAWHLSGNWDCGIIPTDTCNVIFPAGTPYSCIIKNPSGCKNLTILAGAVLTVDGSRELRINANLVNNGSFVRGTSIVKLIGKNEQTISGSSTTAFYDLDINNTSSTGVVMLKNIEVYKNLRLIDGYLYTNSDTVKMESSEQMTLQTFGPQSFVVGKIRRKLTNGVGQQSNGGYHFPVGDQGNPSRYFRAYLITKNMIGTNYLTVWFDQLARHTDTDMQDAFFNPPTDIVNYYTGTIPIVKVVNGDTTTVTDPNLVGYNSTTTYVNDKFNIESTVNRDNIVYTKLAPEGIWHFEPDAQPTAGYYHAIVNINNFTGLEDNKFGLLKRPSGTNGKYWSGGGGNIKPSDSYGRKLADGVAVREYLTTFSEFGGGGGGGGGLPVKMLLFIGKSIGENKVLLNWATGTEINNDYFTVERSADGEIFTPIGTVKGNGNSSTIIKYNLTDENALKGINYYRIKQTDFDGKFEYSKIVAVNNISAEGSATQYIALYPNPNSGDFNVEYKGDSDSFNIYIMNIKGEIVKSYTHQTEKGKIKYIKMNLRSILPSGVYTLIIDEQSHRIFRKIVVTN
jgi:hypothetical protein